MKIPSHSLGIALVQMTSTDDVDRNVDQVIDLLAQVPDSTDLVCLPENALFLRLSRHTPIPALELHSSPIQKIQKVVESKKIRLLIGSVPLKDPSFKGRTTNATLDLKPGSPPEVVYRKIHLFDVDVEGAPPVRESDSFQAGHSPAILDVGEWQFGLSICYDLRFSELYSHYAKAEVHGLMIPSSFLVPTGQAHWHVLMRARAIENQCFVLAAAQAGRHVGPTGGSRETFGHSLAVDPWGKVLVDVERAGPEVRLLRLDPVLLQQARQQIPQFQHRRLSFAGWS